MRALNFMPVVALLVLPLAAEAQTRVQAESRSEAQVSIAAESLGRERKDGTEVEPRAAETRAGSRALAELRAEGMSASRASSQIASRLRSGASDRAITSFAADASAALDLRSSAGLGGATGGLGAGLGAVGSVGGILR